MALDSTFPLRTSPPQQLLRCLAQCLPRVSCSVCQRWQRLPCRRLPLGTTKQMHRQTQQQDSVQHPQRLQARLASRLLPPHSSQPPAPPRAAAAAEGKGYSLGRLKYRRLQRRVWVCRRTRRPSLHLLMLLLLPLELLLLFRLTCRDPCCRTRRGSSRGVRCWRGRGGAAAARRRRRRVCGTSMGRRKTRRKAVMRQVAAAAVPAA